MMDMVNGRTALGSEGTLMNSRLYILNHDTEMSHQKHSLATQFLPSMDFPKYSVPRFHCTVVSTPD